MKNILFTLCLFMSGSIYAQIPGVNDDNWEIIPDLTDYFDRSTDWQGVNSSGGNKWHFGYPWGSTHGNDTSWHDQSDLNVSLEWDGNNPSDGKLVMPNQVGSSQPGYYYSGTSFHSDAYANYGFFRVKVKLPYGRGFFPAFWLWYAGGASCLDYCSDSNNHGSPCSGWYNEIDVMEGPYSDQIGKIGANYHVFDYGTCPVLSSLKNVEMTNTYSNTHTFSVEWTRGGLEYFCDNIRYHGTKDPMRTPTHNLKIILSAQIAPFYLPNQATNFDQNFFEIYEIESYELKCQYSDESYEILDQMDLNTFVWGVRNFITLGSDASSDVLTFYDHSTFRTEQGFLISKNTFISTDNKEVLFTITKCNN